MAFHPKIVKVDGLRVLLVPDDRQSVTVRVLVGTGSREEEIKDLGSAHFLEHFVFRGAKKYPYDIGEYVDQFGGLVDAYTSQESISFMVKMGRERLETAIDLVGQIVSEPLLPADKISKEKRIIIEEIKFRDDDPQMRAVRGLWELMYQGCRLARPLAGTYATVRGMRVDKLSAYMEKWFVPGNTIVGIVGKWESDEAVLGYIRQSFAGLLARSGIVPKKDVYSEPGSDKARIRLIRRLKMKQATVVLGFRSFGVGHRLEVARILLNIIFGGGWFSRLFKEVRENRGWAYSIGSWLEVLSDTGGVFVEAGLPKDNLVRSLGLIKEIVFGLGERGKWAISQKDLDLAKECYKGRISLKYDSPERVLGSALYDLMFEGRIYSATDLKKKAEAVTITDIREVIETTLSEENLNLVVLGDYDKLPLR
ncbi:MAG TPA: pitrilysin family protein [Patescibacteria group bacterium]|nr:pitrilysin family protein [Patescibacteria group bacterium]